MATLDIPVVSIPVSVSAVTVMSTLPWYNPSQFPVIPPALTPNPVQKANTWSITMTVTAQNQSSYLTRLPGKYNGQDITVGMWVGNLNSGLAWQIISVTSSSTTSVTAIVQDIYRYNTFRDPSSSGAATPPSGSYVVFELDGDGVPLIDPSPTGASSTFFTNLSSRFQYINIQYNYPLYQNGNSFIVGDAVSVTPTGGSPANTYVLSGAPNSVLVGRVTGISDVNPGWFLVNPAQKIVDFLNTLPGGIGDIIYSDPDNPGALTLSPGGNQIYVKLRNNTQTITYSTQPGPTTAGNVFQINGTDTTVSGTGTMADLIASVNAVQSTTQITATQVLAASSVSTNSSLVNSTYGTPVLWTASTPYANATINGVVVTFNVASTDAGFTNYARPPQMAQVINAANIPNIIASAPNNSTLIITDSVGAAITIVNGSPDFNGVYFAGTNSGSGLALTTPASTTPRIQFTAPDARAINFLDVTGHTVTLDFGLISAENGIKAAGLYIEQGLRTATTTVVSNLTAKNALTALVGDQAYVIDSNDGSGNNVGEWSMWLYNGTSWVETSNQQSASTDAKSLEYTLTTASPAAINISTISTGRRVTLITVEVTTIFDGAATLSIGYTVQNPSNPPPVPAGLMVPGLIDLTTIGTYTTTTDILFGTDTVTGDVEITAAFVSGGSTVGNAQIIVSYV